MRLAALIIILLTAPLAGLSFAQDAGTAPPEEETTQERPEFDLDAIGGLVDRGRRGEVARAPTTRERAQQLVQQHMLTCWQAPEDLRHARWMMVTVEFSLNADGSLEGDPLVVSPVNYRRNRHTREAAARAIASIRQCSPFPLAADERLAQNHQVWRTMLLTFRADQPPGPPPR